MFAYYLNNSIPVDFEKLVKAVLKTKDFPQTYFDTYTGASVDIPSAQSLIKWVEEIGDSDRYYYLDPLTEEDRIRVARELLDVVLAGELTPQQLQAARSALEKTGSEGFVAYLNQHTDGWIHAWDQLLYDEGCDHVHQWLTENPHASITAAFEGCDDCAICETMRTGGDPDLEKLREAFATEAVMASVSEQVGVQPTEAASTETISSSQGGAANEIMVFHVLLNDSKPRIWRRIEVPADYTFFALHCAIQSAMGWHDAHLHQFSLQPAKKKKSGRSGGTDLVSVRFPNPELDEWSDSAEVLDERTARINDWFGSRVQQCLYEYDFGDGWDHTVRLERIINRDPGKTYPRCTAGKRAAPPEDCGGLGGFDYVQEVLADSRHEDYQSMREWLHLEEGKEIDFSTFDPTAVDFDDPDELLREYQQLADLW